VTPSANHHQPATLVDGPSSALELLRDEHVRQGFAALDGLERLDHATARRLFKDRLDAEARRAAETLPVLASAQGATPRTYAAMTSEANHTRIRRLLDFIVAGDRVLEVGMGFGYITGVLMRDAPIGGYTGIDLTKGQIAAARKAAELYCAASIPVHLERKNLYDLSPDWVAKHDPDLVLLLEVLEHLPDAEGALATISRCVDENTAILFSVPTDGRIEHVWGHLSIFDGARIRALCAQAGLVIQHIETVQDQWVFVLATKSSSVPHRLIELLRRSPRSDADRAPAVPRFLPIPTTAVTLQRDRLGGKATLEVDREGAARVTVGATHSFRSHTAAVRFPMPGDLRLRVELSFDKPSSVRSVEINFLGAQGTRSVRWTWDCRKQQPSSERKTYALRPGKRSGPFKPLGPTTHGDAVTAEVIVKSRPRHQMSFTLHRLAAAGTEAGA
jgi:2-polyprenyl-3-methyl-5-hydroxy-6-metoxy-1,4-benzoquinol methylase